MVRGASSSSPSFFSLAPAWWPPSLTQYPHGVFVAPPGGEPIQIVTYIEANAVARFGLAPGAAVGSLDDAPMVDEVTRIRSVFLTTGDILRAAESRVRFTLFNLATHRQDFVQVWVLPTYERLERNFTISRGVTLPAGSEYNWTRYRFQATTAAAVGRRDQPDLRVRRLLQRHAHAGGDRPQRAGAPGRHHLYGARNGTGSSWSRAVAVANASDYTRRRRGV